MKLLALRSMNLKLTMLSLMHFATDGLCAYLVFIKLYPDNPGAAFLIFIAYNLLAFVTQSPVGMVIDRYNKPKLFLAISMIMMIAGYALSGFWFISVFMIGMSNSIFHVAGGKYVTDKSGNSIVHLGIFVSTGAVGLMLGQRYFSFEALPYIFFGILILCGLMIIFSEDCENKPYYEEYIDSRETIYPVLAVIIVVFVRAFVGKIVSPNFTLKEHVFILIALATAIGKAMGGICSRIFGIKFTTYVSMTAAAFLLTVGVGNEICFLLGVFAFNFTMPITLYFANILLKGREGFAFGSLAATLAPGYFLAMSFTYSTAMRITTALLCVLSMITIIIVLRRIKNVNLPLIADNNF